MREMEQSEQDERMREQDEPMRGEDREDRLTTRDMATGAVAARQAREPMPMPAQRNEAITEEQRYPDKSQPGDGSSSLFDAGEAETFRDHWVRIQTGFVDEPRRSVQEADELVATTMKRLAEIFARERENLEHEWDRGDNVSTEDFRVALQRYRTFFDRLLSV
ncbi:MAG TPA: hypothetical protein VIV66_18450 [Pyrinomonadaceae bacterium]